MEMVQRFEDRGYSRDFLVKQMQKAMGVERVNLLVSTENIKKRNTGKRLPFVSTYNAHSDRIKSIVYRHWEILEKDRHYGTLFREKPLFSYKRARSVGDQLTRTDIGVRCSRQPTFFGTPQKGTYPCLTCQCGSSIIKGNKFNHPSKGYEIGLKDFATCTTMGVIYMIKCPCGKAYVGKTKRQIRVRIGEHKRSIDNCDLDRMKYVTPVSRHFKTHGHNSKQLRWLVLQVVKFPMRGGNQDKILLQQEVLWIEKLNTLAPMGLNEDLSYSCFY
ncbi:hypothetical protein XELAEV_18031384mg [Xenopus laevis]|uniref:GIY-YIG domain-containing protein n=1 Tax=Xenopus laevis TaxID=8355 RepID=A0A974HFP3_XENLA|nr:hypothetical protein XELAEV_18031384mg [Xenopus laevis]